ELESAADVPKVFSPVRGHNMAKAGLEAAVWDLEAKLRGVSLAALIGGERRRVDVGVSVGIQPTVEQLVEPIAASVEQGCRRVKVKSKPGWDASVLAAIRERFPDLPRRADASARSTARA